MENYDWDNIGKRIKSGKDLTVFEGFPGSNKSYTLTAGRPSKKITSYIEKKNALGVIKRYYQLEDTDYIEFDESIKIVDENAPDESGFFDELANKFSDSVNDAKKAISKNAGYIKDGFEETKNRSIFEMFSYASIDKPIKIAIGIVVAIIVFQVLTLISKFK